MDHTIIHFAILWTLTTIFVPGGQCAIRAELEEHLFAISQLNREPFDLAFVFDITDSMLNDLQQVRIATATILEDVFFKSDFTIENYVLVPFRDPEVGPAQVTSSKSEFEKMLGRLEVYGGSDCMEPSIEAIKQALEACQPKSFIFVFTDAPPKDIQFVDDVIELVQATQSKVIFVLTDGCDNEFGVFHKIAKISKGGFCPLEDQIQANLVVNCIHLSVRGNQVSTLYQTDPVSTLFTAPVDSCLEDLLFTVTSEREVSIVNVYTPAGHRLSKKTLDRRTTKVTEVETPIIGEWSMDVFARRTFTVHIGGHSVCDFDPTFVYNLKPTSYYLRPTVGRLTYIVMNATIPRSGKTKCNCTGARVSTISILQLNGDDIEIFDVDWVVGQDFQVSQALSFVATRDPFVIKTSGRDENNFPFQRISRTIVPGRIGPPVYIPIENTVFWENEGNPLVLPCPFRTLVSVRVLWRRDVYLLYNEPGYETGSNGRLFIVSTNRSDAGLYRCQIQSSEHDVFGQVLQVNIATVPVIEDLQNVMVEPGKDAVFTCKVEGIPNPKITWLYGDRSGRTKKNRLIISNANMSDIGPVTCIATNRAGSTNKTAMLDIGSIPRVALKPNKIAVNKGETVQFTCTANGFPRPTVSWYRNNVLLTDSVSGDQAEKQLTAFSVTFQDRGEYACRATNKHGVVEKVAILNVFMRPVLLKGPSDQTALVSQIITMECIVDGTPEPRIIWRHEGTVIKKKTKNIDIRNNGRMLVIGNAQLSHRGVYRCTGRSDRGKVVAQGFLRVIDPPRITRRFATVSGILDKAVDLITSVSGYPAPSLMWYNGGNNLPVGHRFTMHGNGTLTIQNIQMSDEGNYTLVASNDGGNDTATIYLTINYAPYFFAVPVNVSVVAGNRAVLDCSGKGIPTPVVNWTKLVDGIPQHLPEGGSQLIFYAAQLSDAGIYACALQNIYGQVTASIHLNVIVPPRIIRTETTIATPIYSSVWLNCNATGVPTPNVIWVKDALPLVSDQKTFSIFANGSLHIHNSTKADFGNYQCVAINDGGRDNITLYLDVQGPPRLTAVPTNESLLIGSPLEWSCEATGNPNPSVSWLKNGQKLESKLSLVIASNGTKVTVTKVDLSHSGQYTCKANNSLGEDSTSVYLSVLVPPTMLTVSYVAGLLHSKVLLPCEADGVPKPEILWKLNENILKNDHKYVIFDNGTLGIDSLMESDGSVYECHAVNVVGNVSRHITLDVHIPASITSLVNHEVLLGRNLSLTCSASGNPQPTISWYKDGILIDSTTGVELKDHGTTLVIHKAEQHHAGRYTCQAVNVVTNMLAQQNIAVDSSSEVIVLVPPQVSVNTSVLIVSKGDVVSVRCQATGIPTPHIQWLMSNRSRLLSVIPVTSTDGTSASTLQLVNAQPSDSGEVVCNATNKVGHANTTISLDVQFSPVVLMFPSNQTVVSGSTIQWRCTAESNPPAIITWHRNGEYLNKTLRLTVSPGSSELMLRSVSRGDSGEYSCRATNPIGSNSVSASLEVQEGARIVSDVDLVEGLVGSAALLPCTTQGHPSPQIAWQRQGVIIGAVSSYSILPNGTLRIGNLQQGNNGSYQCLASNVVGNDSKTVQLNVHYGPIIVKPPRNAEVLVGSTLAFICEANGNPPANVIWSKDGVVLNDALISDNGTVLLLSNAQPEDSAAYTCTANNVVNDMGRRIVMSTDATATLSVIVPPRVQTSGSVVVLKGHSIALNCVASGIPTPSLRWLKGNSDTGVSAGRLEIVSADLGDEDDYTCIGENKGGKANSTITVDVHFSPVLTAFPSSQRVVVNGNVTWRCSATADPTANVIWQKDGISIRESDDISVDGSKLTVLNLRTNDAGRYTCVATNYVGSVNASADLLVIVPPSITSTVTQVEGLLGSTVFLPCSSRGVPDPIITWYRGNALVGGSDSSKYTTHTNGTLQMHGVTLSDAGVYRCVASNEGGHESHSITTGVHFAPTITKGPEDREVLVGRNVSFNCSVSGNPAPTVRWYYRETLVTNSNMRLHVDDDQRSLTVVGAQPQDAGLVTCQAENIVTDVTRKITLTAQSSAVLTVIVPPNVTSNTTAVVVSEGYSVSLHCQAAGIPRPGIRLSKGVDEISSTSNRTTTTSEGIIISSSEFHLVEVETEDAGQYVCIATNKAGISNTTVSLDVQFSPVFVTFPSNQTVVAQSVVEWYCLVTANPPATVTWIRVGGRLDDASNVTISNDGSKLILKNVSRLDAGEYSCTATNDIGVNTVSAHLEVHVGVKIVSVIAVVEGLLGSAALLPCEASGHPSPLIIWQRNDISVEATFANGTLRVDNLKESDKGFYQCVASNVVGKDAKSVRLNVHYGPSITVPPRDREVMVGSNATFICEANGNPPASISWFRDGVAVATNFVSNSGTVMTVGNAQPKDSVTYTCTATNTVNDLGRRISLSTNASARLRVIVPPQVQTNTSVVVVRGDSAVLTCVASGIPSPSLRWLKEDSETGVSADQLKIVSADVGDEGRYTCIGENKGGKANSTVTVDVHVSPVLNVVPSDQRIIVNGNVTWRCRATADPEATVIWKKDGSDIVKSDTISVNEDGEELTVLNLRPEDAGRYTCVVSNYVGSVNASARLLVIVPPSMTSTVTLVEGLLGSTMYLPCNSQGIPDPVITWYLRKVPVNVLDTSKYVIHTNDTLQIHNVALSDASVYRCEASNEGGLTSLSITTDVHFAPTLEMGPKDSEVLVGHNISFVCSVSGNPPPIVRWYQHENLVTNDNSRVHVDGNQTSLTIVSARPRDAGLLTCRAENMVTDVGRKITLTAQSSAVLTVIVPPNVTSNTTAVVVSGGDSVSFHCQAAGIPRPGIRLFKGVDEISSTNNRTTTTSEGIIISSNEFHLTEVETKDAGQYVCIATNRAGISNTTMSLDVQFSPVFVIVPSNQTVVARSTVVWRCVVTANPPATIDWSKDGERLVGAPDAVISDDGSELILRNVSRLDGGEYSCTATNDIGVDTASAQLEVLVGAEIVSEFDVVEALLGSIALLPCVASGHPPPRIEWQKVGTSVGRNSQSFANGTLRINHLQQSDHGLYRCVASNVAGNDSKTVQLDVHYGPSIVAPPRDVEILIGSAATFVCETNGNPPASISWSKDGVAVAIEFVSSNGEKVTVSSAQPQDTGRYTCTATNTVSDLGKWVNLSSSASAWLNVTVPPVIVSSKEEVDALLGSVALLPCSATGIPTPSIQWHQQDRVIADNKKYTTLANGTLIVRQLELNDTTYMCVASNKAGRDSGNVTIDVHYDPSFVKSPTDVEVLIGLNVTFTCSAMGNPRPTIVWSRRGRLLPDGNDKITVSPKGDQLTLSFVNRTDAGNYTCAAENVVSDQGSLLKKYVEAMAQLSVIVPPVAVAATPSVVVVEGRNALLRCITTGIPAPTVSWFRNGEQLSSGRYQMQKEILEMSNSEVEDAGQYVCLASNKGGNSSASVTLFVHYPPVVTVHPSNQTILLNAKVTFRCSAQSDPRSLMSWSKDGINVTNSSRIVVSHSHHAIQLTIADVVSNDAGRYVCTGQNYVALSSASAILQVIVPPVVISPSQVIHQLAENTAYLPCVVTGTPTPTIEWFNNTNRLVVGSRVEILSSGMLLIHSLIASDAGMYQCMASNRGGSATVIITLDVQFQPVIEIPPEDQAVLVGSLIRFACTASGNPLPRITWLKGGTPLKNTTKQTIDGGGLTVLSTSVDDTGSYTCLASNTVTNKTDTIDLSVRASAQLTVLVPPNAYTTTMTVTVVKGENTFLHCNATGIPRPQFSWSKDGKNVKSNRRRDVPFEGMTVSNAHKRDSGNYTCTAKNTVGTSSVTIPLDVQYQPSILSISDSDWHLRDSSVTLHCLADGNPPPVYSWTYKGGNVSQDTPHDKIEFVQGGRSLIIKQVTNRYSGAFTCLASNSVGNKEKTVRIRVMDKPQVNLPNMVTVVENETAVLQCNVTGKPVPKIRWLRDGTHLTHSNGVVSLKHVYRSEHGVYTCNATNKAGTATETTLLNVLYRPRILSGPGKVTVTVVPDHHTDPPNVTFTCVVDANEPAEIDWFSIPRFGKLSEGPLYEREGDESPPTVVISEDSAQMTILNVEPGVFGSYTCLARNKQGRDLSTGSLQGN